MLCYERRPAIFENIDLKAKTFKISLKNAVATKRDFAIEVNT